MSEVKILLCDDDPDLQGLLERRLKKMGIEPDVAGDGRVAKGFVDKNHYDVIVTDIYMPEATGLEVMQHAKQKDPDTQVVIITSSATLDNAIDALNHGAFGYLTKPFDHLIVFDNMVSRALEYRTLVVADKRKAEAQRRRGDMLEDEVAQRVQQLQKTQKGLLDLLGSLPDGILVVEEGGKVVLSSPVGERWLAQDKKTEDQPIHAFVGQVHAKVPEPFTDVTVDGVSLHLMWANFPNDGSAKRKAVIIREVEADSAGAGSMVTETVMGIKKGLATLYEQGMGTEVVLNVASQFAVLEQLQGWSTGTGELNPDQASPKAPKKTQAADVAPAPAKTPDQVNEVQTPQPEKMAPSQAPTAPEPDEFDATKTVPPFSQPRERTPTGELGGKRLNTSELQTALRASASADELPVAPIEAPDNATAAQLDADLNAMAASEAPAAANVPPLHVDKPFAELEPANEVQLESELGLDIPTTPSAAAAEPHQVEVPDFVREDQSFPRAESGTGDVPSWINGIEGITDPDLLADFEFEPGHQEPAFPAAQNSEVTDDDSMFKQRVIPEAMSAKLETPTELPRANGNNEHVTPKHEGPITVQAAQADTQMFRNVLAGLSGTQVLSGDQKEPPGEPPSKNRDPVVKVEDGLDELLAAEKGLNELRSAVREAPEQELPIETPPAEPLAPSPEELRQAHQPEPEPLHVKPGSWPPILPTQDEEWDDNLDVSG